MTKIFLSIFCLLMFNISYAQDKQRNNEIKSTIINFLTWCKLTQAQRNLISDTLKQDRPIIIRKNIDTLVKISIDMLAVEDYLKHINSSNYVSETFINNLRMYHKKIADKVDMYPSFSKNRAFFAIPGLDLDPIFGFEPEEILDHISTGIFTKIRIISDKAIVKFDLSPFNQYIFTLTKTDGKWLIDYFGTDRVSIDSKLKQLR